MAAQITTSAQAYEGQSVICTFGDTWVDVIEILNIGDIIVAESSGKIGQIVEMDMYGNSFKVSPLQPNLRFDSGAAPGILLSGETFSKL